MSAASVTRPSACGRRWASTCAGATRARRVTTRRSRSTCAWPRTCRRPSPRHGARWGGLDSRTSAAPGRSSCSRCGVRLSCSAAPSGPPGGWPSCPAWCERLLPRALGRALAHELGHYLLARRAHSRAGLMREAFRPEDLADDGEGQRMQLSAGDARALARRCAPRPVGLTADASAPSVAMHPTHVSAGLPACRSATEQA